MESKPKTILLVEDQIIAAAPVIKILKNTGYEIIYVMRGEDAVIIIEAGVPVDLIVMDIDLGLGICGMTASERINSIRKIPILFFTNHPEKDIKEKTGNILSFNIYQRQML
ncbi:MAG TPA: response regulator [Spirochaetota bacterium]|nr:response regulator [Spirochaetota bacterium]